MPLQQGGVVMTGLGIEADPQPVAEQERLVDGIHLRWAFPRHKGFPWHGFYLYRRVREKSDATCLSRDLAQHRAIAGRTSETFAAGTLSSPVPLVYTDDFPNGGVSEVDLVDRDHVRLTLPSNTAAWLAEVTIGFKEPKRAIRCVELKGWPGRVVDRPLRLDAIEVVPRLRRGRTGTVGVFARPDPLDAPEPEHDDGSGVLFVHDTVDVRLDEPARWVDLELATEASVVEALDAGGRVVARRRVPRTKLGDPLRLAADEEGVPISGLRLVITRDRPTWLKRICFPVGGAAPTPIEVTALDTTGTGEVVIDQHVLTGDPGEIVSVSLRADRITAVQVSGGSAALIEVCWAAVDRELDGGWQPVPQCPQPLTLPVRHDDYPAWQGTEDHAQSEALGTGRVRYGSPADWQGQPFADLYDQSVALVRGGPAVAMADPSRAATKVAAANPPAGGQPPTLSNLHPLDHVLLGSLHPPIAQMLGLAWVDETAVPGVPYDYLIVADGSGVSRGQPDYLLDHVTQHGFTAGLDGWIAYDLVRGGAGTLPVVGDARVHALPGGTLEGAAAAGSAGLTWVVPQTPQGFLARDAPVLHHVWRDHASADNAPVVPNEATTWLTKDAAVLVTRPLGMPTSAPGRPADWPPFPLRYVDVGLAEGWYVYQVSAVDIFGRFSPKSGFAPWWQWAPQPSPTPWYWIATSGASVVHPEAVRILAKRRPPPPTGLTAWALDPQDPTLVADAAYTAWLATLDPVKATKVGLRVQWRWPVNLQQQAPGVTEFRLYWHAGLPRPAGWEEPASWAVRFDVCDYNANVTVDGAGNRTYEVFLPAAAGAVFANGAPLAVSAATPMVYANVTVTAADDVTHTADTWVGSALANRPGNESRTAVPRPVVRVWRKKPDPPEPLVDSDRVYATPADWHAHSYYTFRWKAVAGHKAHVWRAVDEAVFDADWASQPRPAIDGTHPAFPKAAVEPTWNNTKRQAVSDALNAISAAATADHTKAGKQKALKLYRALWDDALRVLSTLPGNERAFTQLTIKGLDATTSPDRRGPDSAANYVPRAGVCAHVDELDGRATNRYLYRATYVNDVHSASPLGAPGTPVRLPNVVPPRAPSVTQALGGDRVVNLAWASNREPDLLEYRVFRTDDEAAAGDVRTMTAVGTVAADPNPAARPASVSWTDGSPPPLRDLWYRVVAVDRPDADPRGGGGNVSEPSPALRARAYDTSVPVPPAIASLTWIGRTAVRVVWPDAGAGVHVLVQAKPASEGGFAPVSAWLPPGTTSFDHATTHTFEPIDYRLRVRNAAGTLNDAYSPSTVQPPP